jgi:outer membrane protein assembly factor BamB
MTPDIIYVGVKAHVAAISKLDGSILWQTKLRSAATSGDRFVTLLVEEGHVYAHTYGELYCLDADTGEVRWKNELDGLSYDIVSLATEGSSSSSIPARVVRRRQAAAQTGTAAATGGSSND